MNELQELKVQMVLRANWLKGGCVSVVAGKSTRPQYSTNKDIRALEKARDICLKDFDIDKALAIQVKINEMEGR